MSEPQRTAEELQEVVGDVSLRIGPATGAVLSDAITELLALRREYADAVRAVRLACDVYVFDATAIERIASVLNTERAQAVPAGTT